MLARNAESLYWIGRYVERADDTARILDVNYHMLLEQPPPPWPVLGSQLRAGVKAVEIETDHQRIIQGVAIVEDQNRNLVERAVLHDLRVHGGHEDGRANALNELGKAGLMDDDVDFSDIWRPGRPVQLHRAPQQHIIRLAI